MSEQSTLFGDAPSDRPHRLRPEATIRRLAQELMDRSEQPEYLDRWVTADELARMLRGTSTRNRRMEVRRMMSRVALLLWAEHAVIVLTATTKHANWRSFPGGSDAGARREINQGWKILLAEDQDRDGPYLAHLLLDRETRVNRTHTRISDMVTSVRVLRPVVDPAMIRQMRERAALTMGRAVNEFDQWLAQQPA